MLAKKRSLLYATLAVMGTIIGAGMFALPSVFARLGLVWGTLLFAALTVVTLVTHLLLVELVLAERVPRRLPGHAKRWLGRWGGAVAGLVYPAQIIGADVVYILLGGAFLDLVARQFGWQAGALFWQVLFWAVMAYTVYRSLSFVAKVEAWATWALLASMVLLLCVVRPQATPPMPDPLVGSWVFGFGIILFALTGFTVIAEAVELVGRRRTQAHLVVTLGTLISALFSWLFGVRMYAATGGHLTDALAYIQVIPSVWLWVLPLFGFLAVATSFITSTEDFQSSLMYDLGWDERVAWGLSAGVPLIVALVLQQEFVAIISFVGALFVGTSGSLIAFSAIALARKKHQKALLVGGVVSVCAYAVGIIHAILQPIL